MEGNRSMTSEFGATGGQARLGQSMKDKQETKASGVVEFSIQGTLICFDVVKIGRLFCSPKPDCSLFQYHQSDFQRLEALLIKGFTGKPS